MRVVALNVGMKVIFRRIARSVTHTLFANAISGAVTGERFSALSSFELATRNRYSGLIVEEPEEIEETGIVQKSLPSNFHFPSHIGIGVDQVPSA